MILRLGLSNTYILYLQQTLPLHILGDLIDYLLYRSGQTKFVLDDLLIPV